MTSFQNFTEDQEKVMAKVLKPFKGFFDLVILDPTLASGDKYKVFGKFNKKKKHLKINPRVFASPDFVDETNGRRMTMLEYVLLHEIAHEIYKTMDGEELAKWNELSGWTMKPANTSDYTNLTIPDDGIMRVSKWYYRKEAEPSFPRWYAKFSPKEDFTDSWAFVYKNLLGRLEGNVGARKIDFINSLD